MNEVKAVKVAVSTAMHDVSVAPRGVSAAPRGRVCHIMRYVCRTRHSRGFRAPWGGGTIHEKFLWARIA